MNRLLASLPADELARISSRLEHIPLKLGTPLYEPGEVLHYAYFPTTAIVSLHYVTASGDSIETASVGNEGMVGVALYLSGGSTSGAAVVQTTGESYRLPKSVLNAEFARNGMFRRTLLRYTQALVTQTFQNAACTQKHLIEQQLCRLLLNTLDRIANIEMVITQELIASMLGVRREGITGAAGALQQAGIISYRRGHISVLDRRALEARACECYGLVKKELMRLDSMAG
jgi:CRP-like cAMP-binding protein